MTFPVSALLRLHNASAGNPVPSTWFAAIKAGNYKTFPGLTFRNAMKHCPSSDATIKGQLKQMHQGLRSTKPKRQIHQPLMNQKIHIAPH
jgi:hypothetical protein